MENLEKDSLDFIVESEVRGVNGLLTFKEAVKLMEEEYNNNTKHNRNDEIFYLIKCLKNFYKTKAFKSIENIRHSFINCEINTRNMEGVILVPDTSDGSSGYHKIYKDYTISFHHVGGEYELKILREDEILLTLDTSKYKKTVPNLSTAEYNILDKLELEDSVFLCRNRNGNLFFMYSNNHPLINSNYDSDATPSIWVSDLKYSGRIDLNSDLFSFVTWESGKCWSKEELDKLKTTICKLEV